MSLLQSLGLANPVAGPIHGASDIAADEESPSRSDGPRPAPPSGAKPKKATPAPSIDELAQWPSRAHHAWKRLDHVRQSAVAVQMASRYGQAFAEAFVAAAKAGKTKLEGAHFVTAQASQTPDAMKAAGYKLAQYASNGDRAQEWWVRPDGFEVFLLRVVGTGKTAPSTTGPGVAPPTQRPPVKPPVEPPDTCSKESLRAAGDGAQMGHRRARRGGAGAHGDRGREGAHGEAERDLGDFKQAYEAMTERLKDQIKELEDVIGDVTTAKDTLQNAGCDLSKLDTALDDLNHELIAFEVEKSLHEGTSASRSMST